MVQFVLITREEHLQQDLVFLVLQFAAESASNFSSQQQEILLSATSSMCWLS